MEHLDFLIGCAISALFTAELCMIVWLIDRFKGRR